MKKGVFCSKPYNQHIFHPTTEKKFTVPWELVFVLWYCWNSSGKWGLFSIELLMRIIPFSVIIHSTVIRPPLPPRSVYSPPQISQSLMIVIMMMLGEISSYNFSICPTALIRLLPMAHLNTQRIESNENILDRSVVWISTKCLISFNRWKNKKQVFIVSTNILRTIEGDVDVNTIQHSTCEIDLS